MGDARARVHAVLANVARRKAVAAALETARSKSTPESAYTLWARREGRGVRRA